MAKKQDEIVMEQTDEETTQEATHETTPEAQEDTITLSSKELENRINKGRIELGRTLKSTLNAHSVLQRNFDAQVKRVTEFQETLKSFKQKERERELQSVEGTPDLVDSVRLKHQAEDEWEKVTKARSEHEEKVTQFQTKIDAIDKREAQDLADTLAKESGLTADLLLQIGSDTADTGKVTYNLKRMEAIAKSVPKGEEEEEEEVAEGEEKQPAVRGQRSRATGAGGRTAGRGLRTFEDYEEAFNHGDISFEQYQEAAKRFNKNI